MTQENNASLENQISRWVNFNAMRDFILLGLLSREDEVAIFL